MIRNQITISISDVDALRMGANHLALDVAHRFAIFNVTE
jgi:hypothetical protein